ncbi:MAG: hypothetical protein QM522_01060 [Chitinophagaceae bacterium]|jgi:hypothetical protein|nr:hypothetical protein [Chitinophagaceae bacterium]
MREIVFRVLSESNGLIEAETDDRTMRVRAPSLEDLHHEAREALITRFGPAHCAYKVRFSRALSASAIRPLRRPPAPCR